MDKTQFIKLHLSRLVNSLAPQELSYDHASNLVNDLLLQFTLHNPSTSTNSTAQLLREYESLFVNHGRSRDWSHFKIIIQILGEKKSPDDIAKYLTFLSHLLPDSNTFSSPERHGLSPILNLDSSHVASSQGNTQANHTTVHRPAAPLTQSPNKIDESAILYSLQFTLVGQDTRHLTFSSDYSSIELPREMDKCYSNLLSDVLEPALLFSALQKHLERAKGNEKSPIKTAYTRFLESFLKEYASFIQVIFSDSPKSLFALHNQLTDQTQNLRLLSYLNDRQAHLDGFGFLEEVYKVTQSGDVNVTRLSQSIFRQISVPYYEYIEHWVIKGRLIDENREFFVSFNTGENHVNDIIAFDTTKIPTFMHYEKITFTKILQIGKTLIFLEKYCEELDWVNKFASKYFALVFKVHGGLASMSSSEIQELIDAQFSEVVNFLSYLLQNKYHIFQHLLYMKKVMMMEASDLIENINKTGASLFSQPAMSLTTGKLSDILDQSINSSSLRAIPIYFKERIDARILDLSHGTVGWDVFTLDYKIPEASLEAILNYKNAATQYLRLFNFLWSLRHFQFVISNNYMDFQALHKNDLRIFEQRCRELKLIGSGLKRWKWFTKSVRMISIIRNRMNLLLQAILRYVSFSLIENSFKTKITRPLLGDTSIPNSGVPLQADTTKLPVLSAEFAAECKQTNEFEKARAESFIEHSMREYTIDELTTMHDDYLQSITNCKLFREDIRGRYSGISFVDQIFAFLEIAFSFVKTTEEFGVLLNNYVNLFSVQTGESIEHFNEGLEEAYVSMKVLMKRAYQNVYLQKFEPSLAIFIRDLRSEADLKDLGKSI